MIPKIGKYFSVVMHDFRGTHACTITRSICPIRVNMYVQNRLPRCWCHHCCALFVQFWTLNFCFFLCIMYRLLGQNIYWSHKSFRSISKVNLEPIDFRTVTTIQSCFKSFKNESTHWTFVCESICREKFYFTVLMGYE